jgi:hypothetical protein
MQTPCSHESESGWVVLTGEVYWSRERKLPFIPEQVLAESRPWIGFDTTRGPREFVASRCPHCGTYRVRFERNCEHKLSSGYIFAAAGLFWWSGNDPYVPDAWFRYFKAARNGRRLEVICRSQGLTLPSMIQSVPARRCRLCTGVEVSPSSAVA